MRGGGAAKSTSRPGNGLPVTCLAGEDVTGGDSKFPPHCPGCVLASHGAKRYLTSFFMTQSMRRMAKRSMLAFRRDDARWHAAGLRHRPVACPEFDNTDEKEL